MYFVIYFIFNDFERKDCLIFTIIIAKNSKFPDFYLKNSADNIRCKHLLFRMLT